MANNTNTYEVMKVLNLYAGIGGNRKLWEDVEVTAVESDPEIIDIYMKSFPNDKKIWGDAKEYLLNNWMDYHFIWASPPCPTHSRARYWGWSKEKPVFPDMTLYELIIFLTYHCKNKWCVENVVPYYEPLITPTAKIGRHLFWSNFVINPMEHTSSDIRKLSGTSRKDKLIRNQADPEIGLHILKSAFINQLDIFE